MEELLYSLRKQNLKEWSARLGGAQNYGMRVYFPDRGGFGSVDPLTSKYPGWSPYPFAMNRPLDGIDLDGLEWQPVNAEGENVAPDADNIASYTWAGYNKFAYQNPDGSISQTKQNDKAIQIGIGVPAGTVAEGYAFGDNWGRKYTSDQYKQSGTISYATIQQEDLTIIGALDERIQTDTKKLLLRSTLDLGLSLRITEGLRSNETQNEYYSRSRTQAQLNAVGLTNVVAQPNLPWNTNAYAGQSPHNYGLAFDIVDRNNGYELDWNKLGTLGTTIGLEWGGNWTQSTDRPHFQMANWSDLIPGQ